MMQKRKILFPASPGPARCGALIIGLLLLLLIMSGCSDEAEEPPQTPTAPETSSSFSSEALKPSEDGLDLVFQGGGAKGLAHIGAIKELEAQAHSYRRVVGTSAGSIVATMLAAGFSADEIRAAITERTADGSIIMGSFLVPPQKEEFNEEQLANSITYLVLNDIIPDFVPDMTAERLELGALQRMLEEPHYREIFSLVEAGGVYSGDKFVTWVEAHLDRHGRALGKATLGELYDATGVDLTIVATDADDDVMLMLNHRTAPDVPVAWAVRMSSSIPFVFQEVPWQAAWGTYMDQEITGHRIIDGGATTNLPLELVLSQEPEILQAMALQPDHERVIGMVLDHESPVPGLEAISSAVEALDPDAVENQRIASRWEEVFERTTNVVDTLLNAHDHLVAKTYPEHVCHLPVQGVETLEYDMSEEKIDRLLNAAQEKMASCLAVLER